MSNNKNSQKKQLKKYTRLSGIAIQMLVIIFGGTFVGVKLDEKYPNKHRLFTLALSLTSVIVSIIVVIRTIVATSKEKNK
ncbi:MAG: AtpZ/AtpI family protein [Flavobacteriaceae bacterium]